MIHNRYLERGGEDTSFEVDEDLRHGNGCTVVTHTQDNDAIEKIGTIRTAVQSIWSKMSWKIPCGS